MSLSDPLNDIPLGSRQIAALVLLLGATILPHWPNVGPIFLLFFLAAALWRLVCVRWQRPLPNKWLLAVLMLLGLGLVFTSISVRDGRLSGTALLIVMLGLKLLELKSHRDMYVCIFLGYFVVLTQFLFNTNLWLAVYLFLLSALLTGLLVGINRCHFRPRAVFRMAGLQMLLAIPTALLLFIVFPRLDSPLWALTIHDDHGVTGVSGDMTLGDIGRISQSGALAFRADFDEEVPLPAHLYWRGPVLWDFDGRTWKAGPSAPPKRSIDVDPDSRVDYELTLEPSGRRWVFALDVPTRFPEGLLLNDNHQLVSEKPIEKRALYRLRSHTRYQMQEITPIQRERGLQLPPEPGELTRELARSWREKHPSDDRAIISEALRYFNREAFIYTLNPGRSEGDPVEDFLFEKRRGFCEHYAGSFTVLMRIAGIPARVVVGYQGGTRNPLGGSLSVYQSDAHAWAEVWLEGRGWIRIDPTAAVAPERIENSIDITRSGDTGRIVFDSAELGWIRGLLRNGHWMMDAVELKWHRWVLGFSPERQKDLMRSFGLADLGHYAAAAILLVLLLLGIPLLLLAIGYGKGGQTDPVAREWNRFRDKLGKAGMFAPAWLGPEDLLSMAKQRWPQQSGELQLITRQYVQLRYGSLHGSGKEHRRQLHKRISALRLA